MNRTQNYNLCQWEAADKIQRVDFNADNAKIDAALSGLASGKADAPALEALGIPQETAPLLLVRPVSGNGALAVASDLMSAYGPDSYIGRVAAVMLGSTETTFYTIAVYFGSAGVHKTRHTLPAALAADLTGFVAAALAVRLFFGGS